MFSPFRKNPFPLRAAIQVGCDNLVTGTTARIDALSGAIRESSGGIGGGGLHAEVPISQPRVVVRGGDSSPTAFLDETSIAEVTNALRKVVVRLKTQKPNEIAILLMPPFDRVANTPILCEMWRRELQCQIHLFRDVDFKKQTYLHMLKCRRNEEESMDFEEEEDEEGDDTQKKSKRNNISNIQTNFREQREISKMRAIQRKRRIEQELKNMNGGGNEIDLVGDSSDPTSAIRTAENFEWCWYMSHIVAAKNMAPHRMLLIKENPQFANSNDNNGETDSSPSLEILGCDFDDSTSSSSSTAHIPTEPKTAKIKLLKWSLPSSTFSIPQAHRYLYENIQRRPIEVYKGHMNHSLNPMTRSEVLQLVEFLILEKNKNVRAPSWVINRLQQDGVVCGSSTNGGLLNTCARITGAVNISLEKLEQTNEFHYAGLSDALLQQNYPYPSLVCVQGAVFSALCRHLLSNKNRRQGNDDEDSAKIMCRRVIYLPEVSVTHAMLTNPDMWMVSSHSDNVSTLDRLRGNSGSNNLNIAPSQESMPYPKQAIAKFDPNRVRW